jgi:hypothetical protein
VDLASVPVPVAGARLPAAGLDPLASIASGAHSLAVHPKLPGGAGAIEAKASWRKIGGCVLASAVLAGKAAPLLEPWRDESPACMNIGSQNGFKRAEI